MVDPLTVRRPCYQHLSRLPLPALLFSVSSFISVAITGAETRWRAICVYSSTLIRRRSPAWLLILPLLSVAVLFWRLPNSLAEAQDHLLYIAVLLPLVVAAEHISFRPRSNWTVASATVPHIAAGVLLTPVLAALIALVGAILRRPRDRPLRIAYNAGLAATAVGVTSLFLHSAQPFMEATAWLIAPSYILSGLVYCLIFVGGVSTALWWTEYDPLLPLVWKRLKQAIVSDMGLASIGGMMAILLASNPWASPMMILPSWVIYNVKRSQDTINKAHDQAREALELRDEFITVAAHELNTPVTRVLGYVQLLMRVKEDPEQRYLHAIEVHTQALGRLTKLLIDAANARSGALMLHPSNFDIQSLIEQAVEAERQRHPQRRYDVETPPLELCADQARLGQALHNLLDNAARYSAEEHMIKVKARRADDHLAISVIDHGNGLPIEKRDKLFQPYMRAHTKNYESGIGLGLYMTRLIAVAHGGKLDAKFPHHGGAVFTIYLPISPSRILSVVTG